MLRYLLKKDVSHDPVFFRFAIGTGQHERLRGKTDAVTTASWNQHFQVGLGFFLFAKTSLYIHCSHMKGFLMEVNLCVFVLWCSAVLGCCEKWSCSSCARRQLSVQRTHSWWNVCQLMLFLQRPASTQGSKGTRGGVYSNHGAWDNKSLPVDGWIGTHIHGAQRMNHSLILSWHCI